MHINIDMTLPASFIVSFTSNANLTTNESANSTVAPPVDSSYMVIASDSTPVYRTKQSDAPTVAYTLTSIETFSANAGKNYFMECQIRKTVADDLGIPSWVRPGFDGYLTDDFSNTTTSFLPIAGSTFGEGITGWNGFIDTTDWELNQWYTVGTAWTADQNYPYVRPRIRLNRKNTILPDIGPYSNAVFEVSSMVSMPSISISDIQAEFGGPIPAQLSNYYKKSLLTAITANVVDLPSTLTSFLESESGNYQTNFSNGVSYFTTDGGNFGPTNDLSFGISEGSLTLTTDATYGTVLRSQGLLWGGVVQPKAYGTMGYYNITSGNTYTLATIKQVVVDPTNTANSPQIYGQLWCYDNNCQYVGSFGVFETPLSSSEGWQTLSGTFTLSDIHSISALANTAYVRPFVYDNWYAYYNDVGDFVGITCNCVVETASLYITSSGSPVNGGLGINKIYYVGGGADDVYVLSGATWSIDSTQSISDLGEPRQATNPYTNRVVRIGNFYVVDTEETASIPSSGQLQFSDFLGTSQTAGPIWLTNNFWGNFDGNNPFSVSATAYSLANSPIYFTHSYLPGGITNVSTTANTVTIGNSTYTANTITFSGTTEYSGDSSYPIGWWIEASDPYITIQENFYYNTLNNPPEWSTSPGSLGSFSNGSAVSITLSAIDPEHYAVEYSLSNSSTLPSGLILSDTGIISGTLSEASGSYAFDVSASDGYFSSIISLSITVI